MVKVVEIQVGGVWVCHTLEEAVKEYQRMLNEVEGYRAKINFTIELPDGQVKSITIRDDDEETIAYGDFEGLPSFLDWANERGGEK